MSGVSPISMINNSFMQNIVSGEQALTAKTRAKLIALGVDVSNIRTEAEGKMKLQTAQLENNSTNKAKSSNQEDQLLERAKSLADDLNVKVSDFDNLNDIVGKIKDKIDELKAEAGEDFDKKSDVAYYEKELSGIEQSQMNMIDISSTMNMTASLNMVFHGLS